jgi:hypothetical protein
MDAHEASHPISVKTKRFAMGGAVLWVIVAGLSAAHAEVGDALQVLGAVAIGVSAFVLLVAQTVLWLVGTQSKSGMVRWGSWAGDIRTPRAPLRDVSIPGYILALPLFGILVLSSATLGLEIGAQLP